MADVEPNTREAAAEKSALSQEIDELLVAVNHAVQTRERLPQPLFWSLFGDRIRSLRARKGSLRELDELLSRLC